MGTVSCVNQTRPYAVSLPGTGVDCFDLPFQVNERQVAGDGFMLNFLSVMQILASKVTLDKVDPMYLHSPNVRISIKDDTR